LLFLLDLFSGSSPGSVPFGSAAMDFISFSSASGGAVGEDGDCGCCGRAWRSEEKLSWLAVVGRSCCCCGARWRPALMVFLRCCCDARWNWVGRERGRLRLTERAKRKGNTGAGAGALDVADG